MADGGDTARRPNRIVVIVPLALLALAALYALFWLWAATRIESDLEAWATARRAEGYRVAHGAVTRGGFPRYVEVTIPSPVIEAPAREGGWGWRGQSIVGRIRPFSLGDIEVTANGNHDLTLPAILGGGSVTLAARSAGADASLGRDGHFRRASIRVEDASIAGAAAPIRIGHLAGRADWPEVKGEHTATSLAVAVDGSAIDLPPSLKLPFGPRLESLDLRAEVRGVVPPGPAVESLARWREEGGTVEVGTLGLRWPPLSLHANGTMALDDQLQPIGALTARIQGFFEAVDALTKDGVVRPRDASMAKVVLGMLAKSPNGGGPPTISVPLTIQDRLLFVGPVKLVPLPDIHWSPDHHPAPPGAAPKAAPRPKDEER